MARVWLVTYDIREDRNRRRIDTVLSGFGKRVQKSAFECDLSYEDLGRLQKLIRSLLNVDTDSVRYYPVCIHCQKKTMVRGPGEMPSTVPPYHII